MPPRPLQIAIAAVVAIVFGCLTVLAGGRALVGGADMGAVVPFVLWFNFAAGFAYIAAGQGLWTGAQWAPWLSCAIALATLAVFGAFLIHVGRGYAYEPRTAAAMTLRTIVWIVIAILSVKAGQVR